MDTRLMYWPAVAMAALTFIVWLHMYSRRVAQMKRERIHPQAVATSAQLSARLTDSASADNFRNLFELPVLFMKYICSNRTQRTEPSANRTFPPSG